MPGFQSLFPWKQGSISTTKTFTLTTDTTDTANASYRFQLGSFSSSGNWSRFTFTAPLTLAAKVDNIGIGVKAGAGNAWDTSVTPVEIKFSGVSGFNMTSGQSVVSDWTFLPFLSTDTLVIIYDLSATNANIRYESGVGLQGWQKVATDSYNVAAPAGFSSAFASGMVYLTNIDTHL